MAGKAAVPQRDDVEPGPIASVRTGDSLGQDRVKDEAGEQPEALAEHFADLRLRVIRIGLEAGPLPQWLREGLVDADFEVVLLETRTAAKRAESGSGSVLNFGESDAPLAPIIRDTEAGDLPLSDGSYLKPVDVRDTSSSGKWGLRGR